MVKIILKYRNENIETLKYRNAELTVLATFSIHQIMLLLLTIVMCMLKYNYVQSIKRRCISFIVTTGILSALPLWLYSLLITLSGDVETNPGPKRNSTETFSFCHWNLNSISSHNCVEMFLLKAYILVAISDFHAKSTNWCANDQTSLKAIKLNI